MGREGTKRTVPIVPYRSQRQQQKRSAACCSAPVSLWLADNMQRETADFPLQVDRVQRSVGSVFRRAHIHLEPAGFQILHGRLAVLGIHADGNEKDRPYRSLIIPLSRNRRDCHGREWWGCRPPDPFHRPDLRRFPCLRGIPPDHRRTARPRPCLLHP